VHFTLPRSLSLTTNPAGWLAAAGAVFAAATMIYNAVNHHGVIDTGVIVAAAGAVGAILTRSAVTPVADPKNGAGVPLVPVVPVVPVIPTVPGVSGTVTA
jgi:hypothetical protein